MTNLKWGDNPLNHLNPYLVFFRRGLTKADLNSFGKVLELRDKFTIRVTMGTIISTQWVKKLEGI